MAAEQRETIFEFVPMGAYVRVTAMDTETLTEVSIVGPADGGPELLKRTAKQKLDWVMAKQAAPPPKDTRPAFIGSHSYGPDGQIRRPK